MNETPLASIIINNYNYGRYLGEAIESALNQTYPHTEVIVVDDGSTDDSREIIAGYGSRILPILKANEGQASTFNAGFLRSRGDVICFLDADDLLLPTALETAATALKDSAISKVQWPLRVINADGTDVNQVLPQGDLSEGDLRETLVTSGPDSHVYSPTSGNVWARWFLKRVLPAPDMAQGMCADAYLCELAALLGPIRVIPDIESKYRVHGKNNYTSMPFVERVHGHALRHEHLVAVLEQYCRSMDLSVDKDEWKKRSWFSRIERSLRTINALVPFGGKFILVDGNAWDMGSDCAGRQVLPFLERDGEYWGPPPDDDTAIFELHRMREEGAECVVFAWPAFWWLSHYTEMRKYLTKHFPCVEESDSLVAFDLRR